MIDSPPSAMPRAKMRNRASRRMVPGGGGSGGGGPGGGRLGSGPPGRWLLGCWLGAWLLGGRLLSGLRQSAPGGVGVDGPRRMTRPASHQPT